MEDWAAKRAEEFSTGAADRFLGVWGQGFLRRNYENLPLSVVRYLPVRSQGRGDSEAEI